MTSSTPDVPTLLRQMSSLGISPQRLKIAMQNPFALKELLDEFEPQSTESSCDLAQEFRRVQATAAKERELGPARSDPVPRVPFIQGMNYSRKEFEDKMRNSEAQQTILRKAFVGTEKYFSQTPLCDLERSEYTFAFSRVK